MSLWEAWKSILFRKAFFVQGFGFFLLLQVSKQNCCLAVLPTDIICRCKMGPVILYVWKSVAVARSRDFHPSGIYGYDNHSF